MSHEQKQTCSSKQIIGEFQLHKTLQMLSLMQLVTLWQYGDVQGEDVLVHIGSLTKIVQLQILARPVASLITLGALGLSPTYKSVYESSITRSYMCKYDR